MEIETSGEKRGRLQGRIEGKIEFTLKYITAHFGEEETREVQERLKKLTHPELVERLVGQLFEVTRLEKAQQLINNVYLEQEAISNS